MRLRALTAVAIVAAVLSAGGAGGLRAQDAGGGGFDFDEPPPKPLTPEEEKDARALFVKAKELLEKDQYQAARSKFREFLKKYPGADQDLVDEAEDRSGENCLVGIEQITHGGPPERRIDFELMGDGYILQKVSGGYFKRDAENQMKEFWKEPLFDEYAQYFNVWRFDLISAEDGVDELTMAERMGQPEPEPKPGRSKRGPKKYSTALNCQAAGPAGQVWADPEQVNRWRKYFKHSDQLTIAFAKKGQLGMGGMGIATTGKRVAVVHEVGHAFIGLLDEYTGNPNPPGAGGFGGFSRPAANSAPADPEDPKGRKEPPLDLVPWRHWIEAGNKEVGLFLGGATYSVGMFRPASDCSMNSGSAKYCWVCREAGVLKIYEYVSPIDEAGPLQQDLTLSVGETKDFFVQPMAPKKHALNADWYLERVAPAAPAEPAEGVPDADGFDYGQLPDGMWKGGGDRGFERRKNPLPADPPGGIRLDASVKKVGATAFRSSPKLPALDPGTYRLTVVVVDDAKVPGYRYPWVIKDTDRLLEERRSWTLNVVAPMAPAPPPPKGQ